MDGAHSSVHRRAGDHQRPDGPTDGPGGSNEHLNAEQLGGSREALTGALDGSRDAPEPGNRATPDQAGADPPDGNRASDPARRREDGGPASGGLHPGQAGAVGPQSGFFPTPNAVFAEGCRYPLALAVYAKLAATPAVWTARGDLEPFEASASLTGLMAATGATHKQARGALAWLIRHGFLKRRQANPKATAVYLIVTRGAQPRAQFEGGRKCRHANDFRGYPQRLRAQRRAQFGRKGHSEGHS